MKEILDLMPTIVLLLGLGWSIGKWVVAPRLERKIEQVGNGDIRKLSETVTTRFDGLSIDVNQQTVATERLAVLADAPHEAHEGRLDRIENRVDGARHS